ncbi:MAG: DUF881 domain-containing protein [Cytophagales bacterium]|nr:DUF881 domain-containing protein [Armatimonadota bacterium]
MSVFTSQIRHKPWVTQITVLSAILGGLLALSLKTQDRIRGEQMPSLRPNQFASAYSQLRDDVVDQKKTIADLQSRLNKYQKAAADESGNAKLLSTDLQKANLMAGLVAVTGPGVIVTLRDSKKAPPRPNEMAPEDYITMTRNYIIHSEDIQGVINELRASGAEAIAVNDQRVVATTAIRCVGPVVQVNSIPTNGSPVRIKAVGDPDMLVSAMTMASGLQDQYKVTDPTMFSIDKAKTMTLPAFAGAQPIRFARPAQDQSAEQAQRQSEDAASATDAAAVGAGSPLGSSNTTTH